MEPKWNISGDGCDVSRNGAFGELRWGLYREHGHFWRWIIFEDEKGIFLDIRWNTLD